MNGKSTTTAPIAMRLKGKVAIITGGASGFGEMTAKVFVQQGAKVIIADVQDEKGISLCNEIISSSNNHAYGNNDDDDDGEFISYVHCNVSDETDVKNLIDLTISKHGKLDIMFNNAGIPGDLDPTIVGATSDNFNKVFNINVYGGFLGAKHAARVMIPRKSGVILFTASVASLVAGESPHAYTMSKHAIIGLMKNLCVEMGQYGIRVNAISPCGVSTPLLSNALGMDKESVDRLICESAVLKGVAPEALDVANAALFLASDEAKFVTGLNFVVDGGYSVTNPSFSMAVQNMFS
ncbi:short chain aldehyde dehydrogenase 1 isoform X2 [Spinacia oleracea]|uniref:Short chain aldehyde dehydrogenase 1 isoform X2 n=1 Tax=Spinacia oleracea TaxID=3562 RepID=A0A9R0JBU3_SPIOL|nr:short chain aldehyde dehydrogenase 1-like isoform X2 [Spinacia oleracea]